METLPTDIILTHSSQDAHSVADKVEVEEVTTVGKRNVRRSCWDASIAERTFMQLFDICPVVSSRLPMELWERIIDFMASRDEDSYNMQTLGQVCRGWSIRRRFHYDKRLKKRLVDRKQVYQLISALGEHPERCRAIRAVWFDFGGRPIGPFGSFAVRMMQKLPQVERLRLEECTWETGQLHTQVFLHVALTFGSITLLTLYKVTFPSAVVFGRLVRALPRLSSLNCLQVQLQKCCNVAGAVRVPGSLRLDAADLHRSDDVFDFFVLISVHLRHLTCYGGDLEKLQELLAVSAESLLTLEVSFIREVSVDLTPAVNLRVLVLNGGLEGITDAARILSRASLLKLVEVTIVSWPANPATFVSIQRKLNSIDSDSFADMDRILSGKQFPALQRVTFSLCCSVLFSSEVMDVVSERSWRTLLSSKLPALHTSDRLLSSVTLEVMQPGPHYPIPIHQNLLLPATYALAPVPSLPRVP
ncbi:uncharacterized protein FIBRA_07719 [Fibroporia radiculosa]|uniref:F-box domain-containing protein n=1 Tax=Fibroporia radiculosa TaxID=599839 RepID=J4IBZ0_9APHY|nr:uncharacterized protein FIBRA_07719 [Fibroporia radiculosa]CCM05496.1 predicted protein [Fibroporia radiculosa]